MKNRSLYLGGGFREHQILYMLPIIDGACKRHNIKKIILEKKLSKRLLKLKIVKQIIEKYQIFYEDELYNREFIFYRIPAIFFLSCIFFIKSFFLNKNKLLNKNISWFETQINHSIWDTCIKNNKKKLDKFEFISRIKSSKFIAIKYFKSKILIRNFVKIAFVQHVVYQDRASFALLRKYAKIIVQNKSVLIEQSKKRDYGFKHLGMKIYRKSEKIISNKIIKNYWKKFLNGYSEYLEARNASRIRSKNKIDSPNVIMLHVFRDSPFTDIDTKRIFPDYYSWVVETLKIIKSSKEKWVVRMHPSATRWGENQNEIISEIFNYNPKHTSTPYRHGKG